MKLRWLENRICAVANEVYSLQEEPSPTEKSWAATMPDIQKRTEATKNKLDEVETELFDIRELLEDPNCIEESVDEDLGCMEDILDDVASDVEEVCNMCLECVHDPFNVDDWEQRLRNRCDVLQDLVSEIEELEQEFEKLGDTPEKSERGSKEANL